MTTPEIILHQYSISPNSQKILLALALKKIPFKSFMVEPVPEPRVVTNALVGGYRRIPVLQIVVGADLYCDTHLILEVLEEMFPNTPRLTSKSNKATIYAYKLWGDKVLSPLVLNFLPWDKLPKEIKEDREKALGTTFDPERLEANKPNAIDQLTVQLATLEESLSDGRKFILGDSPTHADIHIYVRLSTLQKAYSEQVKNGLFGSIPFIIEWYERITLLAGPDVVKTLEISKISKEDAIATAETESSKLEPIPQQAQTTSLIGKRMSIIPDDVFKAKTEGIVVKINSENLVLRRSGEWEGKKISTNVHFPRNGFIVNQEN